MSSRAPNLRHARPVDPRSRSVVGAELAAGTWCLTLACGHVQHRRVMCLPRAIICTDCPTEVGLGGRLFERSRG